MHKQSAEAEIIQFPRKQSQYTKNPIEVINRVVDMKLMSVEEALSFIVPTLFESIEAVGFKIGDSPKTALIIELLRSCMLEHYDIGVPLNLWLEKHEEEFTECFMSNRGIEEYEELEDEEV